MGYPVYKLLRAVNRQYPNNGFINYVDVTEDNYKGELIDEDLRDLINEALNETYIHIARDEVFTFPTVPGQREYALPEDCDLRDIQEVVRRGSRPHYRGFEGSGTCTITFYSNGGTGRMEKVEVDFGSRYTLPACTFEAPEYTHFKGWQVGEEVYYVGETINVYTDMVIFAVWERESAVVTFKNITPADLPMYLHITPIGGVEQVETLLGNGGEYAIEVEQGRALSSKYARIYVIDYYDETRIVDMETPISEDKTIQFTQSADPGQNPGGATPEDPGRDPEDNTPADENPLDGGNSSGAQDTGREPENSGDNSSNGDNRSIIRKSIGR